MCSVHFINAKIRVIIKTGFKSRAVYNGVYGIYSTWILVNIRFAESFINFE